MSFGRIVAMILVVLSAFTALIAIPIAWILMRLWGRRTVSASVYKHDDSPVAHRLRTSLETAEHRIIDLETRIKSKQFDSLPETEKIGIYDPHYDFENSAQYERKLKEIRDKQKALVKAKKDVIAATEWTVEGSKAKGRTITNDIRRLMMRAFNGECDALVSKVKHNNIHTYEDRIERSFVAINKMGERFGCSISETYLELKIDELRIVHEFAEHKEFEREEQKRIREQMREEQRAIREAEKARRDAEKETKRFEDALVLARRHLEQAQGAQADKYQQEIAALQEQLAEAEARGKRAISQAELTKSGHVYIVSNVGSFGENTFKIGMTRRLEPLDRVKELGDASVPFPFDIHAMIYSTDAPTLEKKLHRSFRFRRMNLANHRKEFFHTTLDEIIAALPKDLAQVEYVANAEAREYRESLELRKEIDAGRIPEIFLRAEDRIARDQLASLDDDPKELVSA